MKYLFLILIGFTLLSKLPGQIKEEFLPLSKPGLWPGDSTQIQNQYLKPDSVKVGVNSEKAIPEVSQGMSDTTVLFNKNEIYIKRLQDYLKREEERYYTIHDLLNRFLVLEATDELLNIKYYSSKAMRLDSDQAGLQFIATSKLPASLSPRQIEENLLKFTKSYVRTIKRYERVSNVRFSQSDSEVQITFSGRKNSTVEMIEKELHSAGIPHHTVLLESNEPSLQFILISDSIFRETLAKWEQTQQETLREIRILRMKK